MVSTQSTVQEAFARFDPKQGITLLAPEIPDITVDLLTDVAGIACRHWCNVFRQLKPNGGRSILLVAPDKFVTQLRWPCRRI
jgi:hypothetical protein